MSKDSPEFQSIKDEQLAGASASVLGAAEQRSMDLVFQHYKDNSTDNRADNNKLSTAGNGIETGGIIASESSRLLSDPLPVLALDGSVATTDIARQRPARKASPLIRAAGLPEGGVAERADNVMPPFPKPVHLIAAGLPGAITEKDSKSDPPSFDENFRPKLVQISPPKPTIELPKPKIEPTETESVPINPAKPSAKYEPPPPATNSFDPDALVSPRADAPAQKQQDRTNDIPKLLELPGPDSKPTNFVNAVQYPNGNSRQYVRDDNGQVNSVTTKDREGKQQSQYVRDGAQWYFQTPEGLRAKIDGQIQVNARGDISFTRGDNTWRTERTDGTVILERQNPDGSRVGLTDQGLPETITRADGSSVNAKYVDGKITQLTEIDTNGNSTVWMTNGEVFQTDPVGKEQRKNVELNANGTFSYVSLDGFRYTLTGDNTKLIDDLGLTTKKDAQGRVQEITYPGGAKVRTFDRDEQGNINAITTRDETGARTYRREGNKWVLQIDGMPLPLPGTIQVSGKGDVSFETKPGIWRTEKTNGAVVTENSNENGSRVSLTQNGHVEKITRKDGSVIEAQYSREGKMVQVTEYNAEGGSKTIWANKGDRWESNPGSQQRKSIDLMPNGITATQGMDGLRTVTLGDGNVLREGPGSAKFAFDKQGRFQSITYPDGDQLNFKYDTKNQLSELHQIKNGAVLKSEVRLGDSDQWKVTGKDGKDLGTFNGEIKVTSSAEVRHRDKSADNPEGYINVKEPDGSTFQEKLNPDGSRVIRTNDKSLIEIDKDNLVRKISTKDGYRTLDYENGQLSRVVDYQKDKLVRTWESKPDQNERKNPTVSKIGELRYLTSDGRTVIEKPNQTKIEVDQNGYIAKVTQPNGNSREFSYQTKDGLQVLQSITDRRKSGDKERIETWTRKTDTDGYPLSNSFVNTASDGSVKTRNGVIVDNNGDYQYATSDGRVQIARAGRDANENGFSETVEEARDRLHEQMESHMDEPRRTRFKMICDRFERRARERVEAQAAGGMEEAKAQEEWDMKMAKTYDHLSQMLTAKASGAPYDIATRAKLVENATFAMAYPAKANDQGNWGCCWQISGVYLGVIQHPDKMAKMLSELSTSGKFTDVNGKTWTPPGELLSFTSQGANWTIENCGNGRRSPVSEIWTSVASYLSEDGRRMDRGRGGGSMGACMHAMKKITGDTWRGTSQSQMSNAQYKQDLLLKGGVILFSPGHMYLGTLEKIRNQWQTVSSVQHGDSGRIVNAIVNDLRNWRVDRRRDSYSPELPGVTGVRDQPVGPNGPSVTDEPHRPRPRIWRRRR